MSCFFCKYVNKCDGACCIYDDYMERRQQDPEYDVKKWYLVDPYNSGGCAYAEKVYSMRDKDEYYRENPDDDYNTFMTKEEIEADENIRWNTDDSWLEDGKREAEDVIKEKGIETVFGWWKDYTEDQLKAKSDIGFFRELMRQAEAAGLKK